ncbi:MAG: phosphoribosylformylglycinamidine synthase subunit PurS, partial [Dehalococcoidales bacterium]|nr:phosphoribosylformylglycinamidine synthase subunit PurS [Dehalococcoidales bacterium]
MHRVEVCLKSHLPDARGLSLVRDIHDLGITTVTNVRVVDIYWLDADLTPDKLDMVCQSLLADPVTQEYWCFTPAVDIKGSLKGLRPFPLNLSPSPYQGEGDKGGEVTKQSHIVEVAYNAGVTDPVEDTVRKALQDLGVGGVRAVKTAKRYLIEGQLDEHQLEVICCRLLVNPIIQHIVEPEHFAFPENPQYRFRLNQVDILELDNAGLSQVRQRFGFTNDELQAIRGYFRRQGRNPTDAELETLAQTWSEHCVHKTFKGRIKLGETTIDNLLKSTIMKVTEELAKPWCLSVFVD